MSRRPIEAKKRHRVAKKLGRQTPPGYFNLVDWLVAHKHAPTKRAARALILDGKIMADSHRLGLGSGLKFGREPVRGRSRVSTEGIWAEEIVQPYVPVALKNRIIILGA